MLFVGRLGLGDRDPGPEEGAAGGRFGRFHGASVGGGDRADDRQAEPGAGAASGVGEAFAADEPVEDLRPHRLRDPGAGKCDVPGIFVADRAEVWDLSDPIVTEVRPPPVPVTAPSRKSDLPPSL